MNKVQHLVLVLEVVLQNKQRKLQAGKRGWPKFKWPEFEKLPYICFQGRYHNYDFSIEFFSPFFFYLNA